MKQFFLFLSLLLCFSCSKNDEPPLFQNLEGIVVQSVSCSRKVHEVKLKFPEGERIVGIVDLPNEFKESNLVISIDVFGFNENGMACVTLSPNEFYKAGRVSLVK